jgi:nitric oxide reductase NorQ protein
MADNLWLGVREDSELGKLLAKLAENPVMKTNDVSEQWLVKGQKLNRSRAKFVLDVLADATEEHRNAGAFRVRHGVFKVSGVRDALRADKPGHHLPTIRETKTNVLPVAIERGAQMVADAIEKAAPEPQVKPDVTDVPTPGKSFIDGGVEFVFPETPSPGEGRPNYVKPDWYSRMVSRLERTDNARERHVSMAGPPGVGKSTGPEQWAAVTKHATVVIGASGGLRVKDMTGSVELDKGSTRFIVANYAAAAIFGWTVVIDEVNAADADVLMYMNGQLATPYEVQLHGRSFPVHPEFRVVVTYNPGLVGTKPLPQAFKDRFFPIKVGFPQEALLRKILIANGMPSDAPYATNMLRFAKAAWEAHERGQLRYQISPRRLFDTVFLMQQLPASEQRAAGSLKDALTDAVVAAVDEFAAIATLKQIIEASVVSGGY